MQSNSVIHPNAKIGKNVQIEPFCVIHDNVEIGDGSRIGPNATIMSGARIGKNCQIHPGAVIANVPQDLKFKGEDSLAIIGDNTVVRECVTINRGTVASNQTIVGSNCLIMAYVHIGHDCIIQDKVVLVNAVQLAGHIEIGYHSVIGGACAVHQFVRVGDHVMLAGGTILRKDVPHYITAGRTPCRYDGLNSRGMRRRNFESERIYHIQDIYRILFQSGLNYARAIERVKNEIEASEERDKILDFFELSRTEGRGIIKAFR